jgi:hypothetical protein
MRALHRRVLWTLLLAAAAAPALSAETTRVSIFGASIAIPGPPGLAALINKDSHYYRFGARMQSAGKNQLFAYYLPAADAAIADLDQLPSPVQWGMAYGVGPMMNRVLTVEQFQAQVLPDVEREVSKAAGDAQMRRKLGEETDANVVQLGRELKVDAGRLRMGEITPLGTFTRSESFATFGAATRVRVERGDGVAEAPVITVIGFIVAKERMFCIALYRLYRDDKDVEAVRRDAASWAEAIVQANATKP